jgi:putative addiction module component (TIGR02574 family)
LRRLPKRQRLKLAEELWLSSIDDTAPVPAKHKKILDERWAAYQSGKVKPISLAELERRLARK